MKSIEYSQFNSYIRNTWFKDHKAEHISLPEMEILIWANPNRSTYRVTYCAHNDLLYVTGDIGYAIYRAGLESLREWSKCELDYFSGKCVASELGAQYLQWDSDFMREEVESALKDSEKTWDDFVVKSGHISTETELEWVQWLSEYGTEFFGYDRFNWPMNGKRIDIRCRGQLIGLQMAIQKMDEDT